MTFLSRQLSLVLAVLGLAVSPITGRADPGPAQRFADTIRPHLESYCLDCHGPEQQKGKVNLGAVADFDAVLRDPGLWDRVLIQLGDGEMPPEDEPQPSQAERQNLIGWIGEALHIAANPDKPDPGRITARRLNRREYNHTVRDLFGVSVQPAGNFPLDGSGGEGFDNAADTLFLPPVLMEGYFAAADAVLEELFSKPDLAGQALSPAPDEAQPPAEALQTIVERYGQLAFRGPVPGEELNRIAALGHQALEEGQPFEEALRRSLKAFLLSPRFLFRIEEDHDSEEPWRISDWELATRLSYFLWSSMPDQRIFELAGTQQLSRPEVLAAEVERMLADPRAGTLAEHFAGQWLHFEKITSTANPDAGKFKELTPRIREAMYEESRLFFDDLLRNNGRLLDILDADYAYLNGSLASFYGISGVEGRDFQKVQLPDRRRGGVLGMGSILTATSLPLRTSPVLRGKWILEEILGTPPPPPPPLVDSLPDDDRNRKGLTLRQQLELHRAQAECAGCHQRMDPLGFGLENFDPIGRWRDELRGDPIDASGELPSGVAFTGPEELKDILLEQKEAFARNLSERMLGYALGRGIEYFDRPAVDELVRTLSETEFRSLPFIQAIAASYPFQHRRNPRLEEDPS
ncbi:MAG TPA: DUF1592 domain-containing protein [Verrucomicrobiales bacterium]|nr:DUF1592 domain-containing protein [Verrucomicrobiales bacterium]